MREGGEALKDYQMQTKRLLGAINKDPQRHIINKLSLEVELTDTAGLWRSLEERGMKVYSDWLELSPWAP